MKFPDQIFLHGNAAGVLGDCWRTCIAGVLGMSAANVPHFVEAHQGEDGEWFRQSVAWVALNSGATLRYYEGNLMTDPDRREGRSAFPHVILIGPSPRGAFNHCVIGDAYFGDMVHDPHPSRDGLLSIVGVYAFDSSSQ